MKNEFQLFTREELSRSRGRLLARVRRRYQIVEEPFAFGPVRINFTRVTDPDRVLDQVCAEQDAQEKGMHERRDGNELHLPYWAELWDSSIGVGHWLASSTSRLAGPHAGRLHDLVNTLDLGCGMGLAGTVSAAIGHRVTLVDIETSALLFARLNTLPYASRVKVRRMNWQRDRLNRRFDLILGADVLYEKAQWDYLEPFWREHLADDGIVVLGEPGRMTGDLFGEWIASRGWTLAMAEQKIPSRPRPIRLFILNR